MLEEQDIKQIREVVQEEVGDVKKGLEDLGEAIQGLATHVDKRFDVVDGRLDKVEGRLDKVDGRLDKVDERLGKVESSVGNMRNDLINLVDTQSLRVQDQITKAVGKQIQEAKQEIVKEVRTDRERHKLFNLKVLHIFERSKIAQPEEVAAMRELVV